MSITSDPSPYLAISQISRRFGDVRAVDEVSLDLRRGEFFCLLGASGCGKTTLMRIIAGFERPDAGKILLDGQDITALPPHRRPVNMMFQSYALFPHLTVARNIAFGLEQAGLARDEIAARVAEMLALVKLEGMAERKPDALSGGQRQRVALARALARRPGLLLLDEPLGALDKKLREETQIELKAIQARLGTTFLVVTHDQDEALGLADRIAVMDHGRIVQIGTPEDIYERPDHMAVARLVGEMTAFKVWVNDVTGLIEAPDSDLSEAWFSCAALPRDFIAPASPDLDFDGNGWLIIRPENLHIWASDPKHPGEGPSFSATVTGITYRGEARLVHLVHDDSTPVLMRIGSGAAAPALGERLALTFDVDKARVLPA